MIVTTPASTAYLYPWDILGDPDAPARIAGLGVQRVALAAAQHAVRAATPHHPARRVVDARHAALYVPVRRPVWRGRAIAPPPATAWTGHEDAFGDARDALAAQGLAVDAWVGLTHTYATAEHAVWNAFGDVYRYALCPSSAPVRQYAATLVSEVLSLGRPDGLVLEACGPTGVIHQDAHEQVTGADWSPVDEVLLSLCFCTDCRALQRGVGLEPSATATAVRAAVGAGHPDLGTALGDLAGPLLAVRHAAVDGLRDTVVTAARAAGVRRLALFADADPWVAGAASPVTSVPAGADVFVAAASVPAVEALRAAVGPTARLAARVGILPPVVPDPAVLAEHWCRLLQAGAGELHLHHAGPASMERLNAAAGALRLLG